MNTVLERVEGDVPWGRPVFDGGWACCGTGRVGGLTWILRCGAPVPAAVTQQITRSLRGVSRCSSAHALFRGYSVPARKHDRSRLPSSLYRQRASTTCPRSSRAVHMNGSDGSGNKSLRSAAALRNVNRRKQER
jgi:hypothetical protein